MNRVLFLIDGFNVYHSLLTKRYSKYKWLDYSALAQHFIKPATDIITKILFFTAYTDWNVEKVKRHKAFVKALQSKDIEIVEGKFKRKERTIRINSNLSLLYKTHEEKYTDVNIAVRLFQAAINSEYDTAIIITGDTDLVPCLEGIKMSFPNKRVEVVFPVGRRRQELESLSDFHQQISETHLMNCQFPDTVIIDKTRGLSVRRPHSWK